MMKQSYIVAFWTPYSTIHPHFCLEFFIPFLQKYGDIQCLNLQARHDSRAFRLLRQADLVIIGLPLMPGSFRHYFCESWMPFQNVCYALLDYLPAMLTDAQKLCTSYRLTDGSVLRIPYNIRFREAVRSGHAASYLNADFPQYKTTDFHQCMQELTRSGKLILQALNENLLIPSSFRERNVLK